MKDIMIDRETVVLGSLWITWECDYNSHKHYNTEEKENDKHGICVHLFDDGGNIVGEIVEPEFVTLVEAPRITRMFADWYYPSRHCGAYAFKIDRRGSPYWIHGYDTRFLRWISNP